MKHLFVVGAVTLSALLGPGVSVNAMQLGGLVQKGASGELPVVRVQATDAGRVGQLEEQIRSLNGRIEEMSFQLLQMQEQIRKFQEDNEFRFQELEGGKTTGQKSGALDQPATTTGQDTASSDPAGTPPETGTATLSDPNTANGGTEQTLGSIVFDENGNPVGETLDADPGQNASLPGVEDGGLNANPGTETQSAGLSNPDDIYQAAYTQILSGDYSQAEQGFRDYLAAFPEGEKAADASFWMGEAQYSLGNFSEAAKTFLNSHQTYSKSPKAPEMLLKLGMSLAALDNKDTACATLREVNKRYPNASSGVKAKVSSEQSRLAC